VNAVQKLLVYYATKCALPHVHAHLLRHTGITHLLEAGMQEAAVRAFVGHKRPESLQPYTHLHDKFVEAEFRRSEAALATQRWVTDLAASDGTGYSAKA
jgi:site-specific recombinase XerD